MNTLGSLAMWLNLLSSEVGDLAVSKHSGHAKELLSLVQHLLDYAEPTYQFMSSLQSEGVKVLAEEAEAAEGCDDESRGDYVHSIDSNEDGDDSEDTIKSRHRSRTVSMGSRLSQFTRSKECSTRRAQSQAHLSIAILPSACQNVPISFLYSRPFLGSNPLGQLSMLVEGDESLEVKGIKYWREQLVMLSQTVNKVKEDIHISLEEKRNFFNFILTMVTVYLAPLMILCGYWYFLGDPF
jgi:hypothetical protein